MPLLTFAIASGLVYSARKSYEKRKKKSDKDPLVALVEKIDNGCQIFVRKNIDPLLSSSTRRAQLAEVEDTPAPVTDQEKRFNRLIALSCVTGVSATVSSFLFPPLLIPTMALGIFLLLPVYKRVYTSLFIERKLKLNTLMAFYLTGFWLTGHYIFASVAIGLFFFGLKVVSHLEGRSRESFSQLFGSQPRFVWLRVDGVEVKTPMSELKIGDVVVVNAGEPLPVDGVIVEGNGLVDQHMLTGESQPVEKNVGDHVFTSTLLLSGSFYIEVEKAGENTLAAKIVEALNNTLDHQTETELKGQRLADQTVLPNLAASLVALPIVGPIGATVVLGAGLGANMRFFSILATANYLSIASKHNILVKDARALERLKEVDTIVFDKTGTLTLDQPHVAKMHVVQDGLSEMELLAYAATAEYRQPHPIAKAIIDAAEERGLELPTIDEASYEVGYGISVKVKEKLIRVGSGRFLVQQGLAIPKEIEALQKTSREQGVALVLVGVDDQVAGALELHATIRPEAKQVVESLNDRNISVTIISGDQEEPTKKLASELGIDNYFANTLPEDKASLIQKLQDEGRVVCFVGDGINDALALKQADVSVSLQGASSIATDTAQVLLMGQNLEQLPYLIDLAQKYDSTLRSGFKMTIVPGVICIGGVFVAGFGFYAAELLFQLGFFGGLGLAMKPLLSEKKGTKKIPPAPEKQ